MKDLRYIMDVVFEQLTDLGGVIITGIIALFLLFFDQNLAIRIILGIVGVTIVSYLIKIFFFKQRPKKQPRNTFIEKIDASSFPSVHTARITVIIFWLIVYFKNFYLTLFSILVGLLVVYSRIYLKKHYWSDVIGGFIISIIINSAIYFLISGSVL